MKFALSFVRGRKVTIIIIIIMTMKSASEYFM